MIVAAHQPNFLPWLGFFDKMARADIFVIEDTVQFVMHDFQNRNRIKTPEGTMWLTVPVEHNGRQRISETKISRRIGYAWLGRHLETLKANYAHAPYWNEYCGFFENAFHQRWTLLADLNLHLIKGLRAFLGVNTPLVKASEIAAYGKNTELIVNQCKAIGADVYLSGVGAKSYLNVNRFKEEDIEVWFQDFHHPIYKQLHGEFVPNLSIIDYLFCAGAEKFGEIVLKNNPCPSCFTKTAFDICMFKKVEKTQSEMKIN